MNETTRAQAILYTVAALIALLGIADSIYLTVQALTGETAVCGGSANCFQVLGSGYARILGVPVAALGLVVYFCAFSFATFVGFGYARLWTLCMWPWRW